ncbi:hypothetical protein K501DRAFT_283574 [Backusella circina FSU 941]|nr:hypothetical protein K501DRAFT_283574 [Backusella circina FSU 941]
MFTAIARRCLNNRQLLTKRNKVTVSTLEASETATLRRPTPILFLQTDNIYNSKEWTNNCKKELCESGYTSFDAVMTLPNHDNNDDQQQLLQICYQELSQATSQLSFFPPLLIGKGETAWRVCQKYVANKPVSGLVLVHQDKDTSSLPSNEFEPFFPILVMGGGDDVPGFLEEGDWVVHKKDKDIKTILTWMDEEGM